MPVKKAIFQVEVDDSAFKNFKTLFDRYRAAVQKLPQDWSKVGVAAGGVAAAHIKAGEAVEKQTTSLQKQATALNTARKNSDSISQNWRSIAMSAHNVDKAIERSVVKMAKWGGLAAGALGGIAGIGSLLGIDRLANSISSARSSAMGLGISYGQQAATNINYSRLVTPGDIMSNIFTAKHSSSSDQFLGLLGAGISQRDIAGKNPAQLLGQLTDNLPGLFKNVPENQIGTYAHGYKIDSLMSVPDIIRYLHASPEERAQIKSDTQRDSKSMDLQDSTQKAWQDFVTQIGRSTETVKTHFMNRMVAIEPNLEKLSGEVSAMAVKFIGSDAFKSGIDKLGDGLNRIAAYVGSDEFQTGLGNFATWVEDAASAMWKFVGYFMPTGTVTMGAVILGDDSNTTLADLASPAGSPRGGGSLGASGSIRARAVGGAPSGKELDYAKQGYDYLISQGFSRTAALTILGNARGENPLGGLAVGDSGTAFGQFQWHSDRVNDIMAHTGIDVRTAPFLDQLRAATWEMGSGAGGGHILDRLKAAKTEEEATSLLVRGFERPRNPDSDEAIRLGHTKRYERALAQKPTPFHAPEHPHSIVIQKQAGANVPRSMFSIAQPYANATAAS